MKPIEIPIDGILDLHTFSPKELPELLHDYLNACLDKRIFQVRIIHGKGQGIQKARVRRLLSGMALVAKFGDAPPETGGWGATVVQLKH